MEDALSAAGDARRRGGRPWLRRKFGGLIFFSGAICGRGSLPSGRENGTYQSHPETGRLCSATASASASAAAVIGWLLARPRRKEYFCLENFDWQLRGPFRRGGAAVFGAQMGRASARGPPHSRPGTDTSTRSAADLWPVRNGISHRYLRSTANHIAPSRSVRLQRGKLSVQHHHGK